eukprot:jgi/Tetstr1/464171/TSEL_008976.t1
MSSHKRKATEIYSAERAVRAGTSRGNTWAAVEVGRESISDVAAARASAMDSIRRRIVSMLRHSESNKPPEHKSRTIKWIIDMFCSGLLCIHGNSQRGMVCTEDWARQFLCMLLNSPTSVPAITLRKVIETREVDGRTVSKEVFYVTDGAQRLTAILWFYLGLIQVEIIDRPAPRRSQRKISRGRRGAGVEADPTAGGEEEYTVQFYDRAPALMATNQPVFPMVYSPCDAAGVIIDEEEEEVDEDHPNWRIDTSGDRAIYRADAPDSVKDFFEKFKIALDIGAARYDPQTEGSNFASDEVRLRFLSREIGVDETEWSQQAGSHVNLWQSLQQYYFGVNELVSLVGDHASEWLKSLVPDLVAITAKWNVGHEMQMAYGALVRAFVIVHGAEHVPVQDDASLWAFVIDYLGEHFLSAPPADQVKRCFAAAVRNITACNVSKRKGTRLTTDEVTLMIALTYHAIAIDHLPASIDDTGYPASIIGRVDRARLAGHYAVIKAKGAKQKTTKLRSKFRMDRQELLRLAEALNDYQAVEGVRNLAMYVREVVTCIEFDAEQRNLAIILEPAAPMPVPGSPALSAPGSPLPPAPGSPALPGLGSPPPEAAKTPTASSSSSSSSGESDNDNDDDGKSSSEDEEEAGGMPAVAPAAAAAPGGGA